MRKLSDYEALYVGLYDRYPSDEEAAKALGVKLETIQNLQKDRTISLSSFDAPAGDGDTPIEELLPDVTEEPTKLSDERLKKAVAAALSLLSPEEVELLTYLYGLDGRPKLDLRALGDMKGCSHQAISLMHRNALLKLRYPDNLKKIRKEL